MDLETLRHLVLDIPEFSDWPELREYYQFGLSSPRSDWEWPLLACRAVGGDIGLVKEAAAALTCMQLSITLIDDILDHDPRGLHCRIGEGATANIAFALQAASHVLVARSPLDLARRERVADCLARMALGTAYGQSLDVQNLEGEDNYWKTLHAKSRPFYGAAMEIGALAGGAGPEVSAPLAEFGMLNGEIIQVYDDLTDSLQVPANPDWIQRRPNLAILFASTAQHPARARFRDLLPQVGEGKALGEAQQILIQCGALSYCAYHIVRRLQRARELLSSLPLAESGALENLLAPQAKPIRTLLSQVGASVPPELMMDTA